MLNADRPSAAGVMLKIFLFPGETVKPGRGNAPVFPTGLAATKCLDQLSVDPRGLTIGDTGLNDGAHGRVEIRAGVEAASLLKLN